MGALHLDSRNSEVRNSEKVESSVVGSTFDNVSKFGILTFSRIRDRGYLFQDS